MPTPLIAGIQHKLKSSSLVMDTPEFSTLAAEWLTNNASTNELHTDTVGFLATRLENDTRVQ